MNYNLTLIRPLELIECSGDLSSKNSEIILYFYFKFKIHIHHNSR